MARSKFKLRLNSAGVVQLLNDPRVAADLERRARSVQSAMPDGEWEVSTFSTDRANATVYSADTAAKQSAADSPASVVSALDAGRA